MMPHAGILLPTLLEGDAVGQDALSMSSVLTSMGYSVQIFAGGGTLPHATMRRMKHFLTPPGSLLIYHYSIAWVEAQKEIEKLNCHKILKYHNVTPPEFFAPYHIGVSNACRVGRESLPQWVSMGWDMLLSDSEFNQQDLLNAGAEASRCFVVPPFHQTHLLMKASPDFHLLRSANANALESPITFLNVGRIVPNKGHLPLFEGFHEYIRSHNANARLLLVGRLDPLVRPYIEELRNRIFQLGLQEKVHLFGHTTLNTLKSCYLSAHAYVTFSEHEGFCVPLLEAMAMSVPILSWRSSAITGTLNDAGVLLENRDPASIAIAMHNLVSDQNESYKFAMKGQSRYHSKFKNEEIEKVFRSLIGGRP